VMVPSVTNVWQRGWVGPPCTNTEGVNVGATVLWFHPHNGSPTTRT
jgi:hypothetical protein